MTTNKFICVQINQNKIYGISKKKKIIIEVVNKIKKKRKVD